MADLSTAEVIRAFVEEQQGGLHVAMPGRIVSYNATTQRASVRPMTFRRIDETEVALPVIDDVPVCWPRSSTSILSFPLAANDPVWLMVPDRTLDGFRGTGLAVPPDSPRTHDLSDVVCLPAGVWPDAAPDPRVSATDAVLAGPGASRVTIKPDGSIVIETASSAFLGGSVGAQALALAPVVDAQLQALAVALAALQKDLVALGAAVGVGALSAAALAVLLPPPNGTGVWPTSVAALKAKGV